MSIKEQNLRGNVFKAIVLLIVTFILLVLPLAKADDPSIGEGCVLTQKSDTKYLGSATSYAMNKPRPEVIRVGQTGLKCSFVLGTAAIIGEEFMRATFLSDTDVGGNRAELKRYGGNSSERGILYEIYGDPNGTIPLYFNETQDFMSDKFISIFDKKKSNQTIYVRLTPQPGFYKAGTYFSNITIYWTWDVCRRSGFLGCLRSKGTNQAFNLVMHFIIKNDCFINSNVGNAINFGKGPFIEDLDHSQSKKIVVGCSDDNIDYSIGVSMGNFEQGGVRRMRNKSNINAMINYNIYYGNAAGGRVWKGYREPKESPNRVQKSEGRVSADGRREFDFSAVIEPGQAAKPEGIYEDDVIIDFAF